MRDDQELYGKVPVVADEQARTDDIGGHFGLPGLVGSERRHVGARRDHVAIDAGRGSQGLARTMPASRMALATALTGCTGTPSGHPTAQI